MPSSPSSPSSVATRALVFGATGYVGSHLVPALVAAGRRVRAAGRSLAALEARRWKDVELVRADALEPESLAAALHSVDVAYYLVHSMAAGPGFAALDLTAADNFARAAAQAGVKRIVYLGGLVPRDAESEHLRSRRDTGERLRAGAVPVTEIRAGIIVGPGSAAYEVIRDLVYHLPVMVTPRWVRSRSSPIALSNLIAYLVRVPDIPETAGRVFDAAGPDFLSYEAMMRAFGEVAGRFPRIVPVPVLSPRLSSYWLGLVTSVPTPVARALIGGMKHDIPADADELRRLVPQTLLDYKASVREALEAERHNAVAARWTEGVLMYRDYRHDHAFYAKKASGSAIAHAPASFVWRVVSAIGGRNRYYYMDALWWLRECGDWIVGGPGFTHGRRDPDELRVGDVIDYWTVLGVERERRLTLHFGLKAPGTGVLEFEIDALDASTSRVTVTAYWHPRGFWGLLYWAILAPFHLFIFRGMTRAIARRAEQASRTEQRTGSHDADAEVLRTRRYSEDPCDETGPMSPRDSGEKADRAAVDVLPSPRDSGERGRG